MSIMHCPECARDVSDQAASCPHCGYPIRHAGVDPTLPAVNELDALVRKTLLEEGKIAAIKLYRERTPGVGLVEAKDHVERIEAATAPESRMRAKPAGCLGLFVAIIVVIGSALAMWARK